MSNQPIKLAVAQLNLTVGDLVGNTKKIVFHAKQAALDGAKILLTPELSLTSYPPEDLLLRKAFIQQCERTLLDLAQQLSGLNLYVIVGHPQQVENQLFNAVSVLYKGQCIATYHKHELPNSEVFDEKRYFFGGTQAVTFQVEGLCFGLNICEDTWTSGPCKKAAQAGAKILLVPNASPYHMGKQSIRYSMLQERVRETGLAIVYANLVGAQDELVFDGSSFAIDSHGQVSLSMPQFEEKVAYLEVVQLSDQSIVFHSKEPRAKDLSLHAQVYEALKLGVYDYVHKNNFSSAVLGLSGGIDSALTLAIAVDALGSDRVSAVMMPSPYTSEISLLDSREMTQSLGVYYQELKIDTLMQQFNQLLKPFFKSLPADLTEENIQARIRGTTLMAISNKLGAIVLTTGNKSEMAMGYCTLYGDMAGGFSVLKDIYKTFVYQLCAYRNSLSEVIPNRIIKRPPSAELRPNQTDQDSLPPYDLLDAILQRYIEEGATSASIVAEGFSPQVVERVIRLLHQNEYKRRQSPVGVRISHKAFGRDWRYPITSKFLDHLANHSN